MLSWIFLIINSYTTQNIIQVRLIQDEFNIISGFGVGVGSAVITGALEEIYMHNTRINNQRLLLRPFPQGNTIFEPYILYSQPELQYV